MRYVWQTERAERRRVLGSFVGGDGDRYRFSQGQEHWEKLKETRKDSDDPSSHLEVARLRVVQNAESVDLYM